jgi:hypothetical protein
MADFLNKGRVRNGPAFSQHDHPTTMSSIAFVLIPNSVIDFYIKECITPPTSKAHGKIKCAVRITFEVEHQ